MNIFLTGGTGFIGKYVVNNLDNGRNKLLLLSRKGSHKTSSKNITFLKGNLSDVSKYKNILKEFNPKLTIHLAWEGIPNFNIEYSLRNLEYGLNLIKTLSMTGCQTILMTGTLWEYGNQAGKMSENMCAKPFDPLTSTKNSLHLLGKELAKANNIDLIWTRLFYVYGAGQRANSLIPYLINSIKENKEVSLRNPKAKNDFIYVEDVAEAICRLALTYKKSGLFNIGSGKLTSVSYIIKRIFQEFGKDLSSKLSEQNQMDTLPDFYADISRIKRETKWEPKIDIDTGLRKIIESIL